MPKPSDLSFYNWETQTSTSNQTQNFQVIADNEAGLLFKNKRDRKVINVDPSGKVRLSRKALLPAPAEGEGSGAAIWRLPMPAAISAMKVILLRAIQVRELLC